MSRPPRPRLVIDPSTVSPGPPLELLLPGSSAGPGQGQRSRMPQSFASAAPSDLAMPRERIQSTLLPPLRNQREPAYFGPHSPRRSPLGFDENTPIGHVSRSGSPAEAAAAAAAAAQTMLPLSPRQLNNPLLRVTRESDFSDMRTSLRSDISMSSITPSEADMMGSGAVMDPRHSCRSRSLTPLDSLASPLPDSERFSHVPTIFDVDPHHDGLGVKLSAGPATSDSDPFFGVPGSRSTSTRPDFPPPASHMQLCGPAPIFSPTAGTTTGDGASRTLEMSSVGSEELALRKRHYGGCMPYSPLPSPSSSVSSYMPDGPAYRSSERHSSGPPPDAPLPDLVPQLVSGACGGGGGYCFHQLGCNPAHPLREFEGEMAPCDPHPGGNFLLPHVPPTTTTPPVQPPPAPPPSPPLPPLSPLSPFPPAYAAGHGPGPGPGPAHPALVGEPGPCYFSDCALYANSEHGASLSTLAEGDEGSQISHSRQPSRHALSRSSNDAGWRLQAVPAEFGNRPQTVASGEISRTNTHGQHSQHSLIADEKAEKQLPAALSPTASKGRNPFRRAASPLSAVHEFASGARRSSWRSILRRGDSAAAQSVPGADPNDVELDLNCPVAAPHPLQDPPHPGRRLDRPAADGSFSVVELSGPPGHGVRASEILAARPSAKVRGGKFRALLIRANLGHRLCRGSVRSRVKWLLIFSLVTLVALVVALPVVYVSLPSIAAKALYQAANNVTDLAVFLPQPQFVGLQIGLLLPSGFGLASQEADIFLLANRSAAPVFGKAGLRARAKTTRQSIARGVLGVLRIRSVGQRHLLFEGPEDKTFSIQDPDAWAEVFDAMIFGTTTGPRVRLRGSLRLTTAGLSSAVSMDNEIVLPAIGRFDTHVTRHDVPVSEGNTFNTYFSIKTNATMRLDLGTVNFYIFCGPTPIGYTTVDNFSIGPGPTEMIARGGLLADVLRTDPDALGKLMSALFVGNPSTALSLRGANATFGGKEVVWLRPAVQRLEIGLPTVSNDHGPERNSFESFKMALEVDLRPWQPQVAFGYIHGSFSLPFVARGFEKLIEGLGHGLLLSTPDNTALASLAFPLSASKIANEEFWVTYGSGGSLVVGDSAAWARDFLQPLMQNESLSLSVAGNLTAKLGTALGTATVPDIDLQSTTWAVRGYGLAAGNVALTSTALKVTQGDRDGLHLSVGLSHPGNNKATVQLKLGEVVFRVIDQSSKRPIGRLVVSSLCLSNVSNYDGVFILGSSAGERVAFESFLTQFLAGGTVDLGLDLPTATNNQIVSDALAGAVLQTSLRSPGYTAEVVKKVGLSLHHDGKGASKISGAVQVYNPFPVPMSIRGLSLTIGVDANPRGREETKREEGGEEEGVQKERVRVGRLDQTSIETITFAPGMNAVLETSLVDGLDVGAVAALFPNTSTFGERLVYFGGKVAIGLGNNASGIAHLDFQRSVAFTVVKQLPIA